MKKKLIILVFVIVLTLLAVIVIFGQNKETNDAELDGYVALIEPNNIFIQKNPDINPEGISDYDIRVSDSTKIYVNGKQAVIDDIKAGDHIVVTYSGDIRETAPAVVPTVYKIEVQ